jgi:aminopeptidase N
MHRFHSTVWGLSAAMLLAAAPAEASWRRGGDGTGYECCQFHRLEAARWARPQERRTPGFDPVTGRNLLNYPPDPLVEYIHMRLELDISDMAIPRLDAVQTLTVAPIAAPLVALTLDAALLEIRSVSVAGHQALFEHDGARLTITFDPPLPPAARSDIVTTYSVNDPPYGLIWTLPSQSWPGRAPQIHTQGQPEDNRYWFPIHDFPNIRLTTELVVTVPTGFLVLSNGRLVGGPTAPSPTPPPPRGRQTIPAARPTTAARETFHWLQDKPHVPYLVSLVVGQFDVVDVALPPPASRPPTSPRASRGGRQALPMPVYAPPGRAADVRGTYGRTPQMVELFERLIDEPYPWDQYAQAIVWNFAPGGMENTSATTMHDTAIFSPEALTDSDMDALISHELAHQWFGDLITCNSWEHIWLNEGFATYFTNLWFEHRDGRGNSDRRDAYQHGVIGNFDSVINSDRAEAPWQPAMASKAYDDPWEVFRRAANPYPKGAAVLHMLRQQLGDEVFFRALAVYVDRMKGLPHYPPTNAETSDLRKALEDVSGENFEQFFHQWVFRPGVPHLAIGIDWDRATSELSISITQEQNIDGYNPAFEFTLPVWIRHGAREEQTTIGHLNIAGRETTARFTLDAEPTMVVIDPEMAVLARTSIRQPVQRWVAQLERGPTLFARVRAARALAQRESTVAAAALLREAQDPRNHHRLRSEAARALGRGRHAIALIELASARLTPTTAPTTGPHAAEVRLAIVEAAAELARDESIDPAQRTRLREILARHAAADEWSFRTRAAAVLALGRLSAITDDEFRLIVAAAESESQHDRVRQSALEALGQTSRAEALAVVMRYALPGTYNRTRAGAIAAVASLSHHDRSSSFKLLTMTLTDRERRAWEAAGRALVELGDHRAVEPLKQLAQAKRDPRDQARISEWIEALRQQEEEAEPEPAGNPHLTPERKPSAGEP